MKKLILPLLLIFLCACASPEGSVQAEAGASAGSASLAADSDTTDEGSSDGTAGAVHEILEGVDYGENNFVSEREFYRALSEILRCSQIEMTPCKDGSAYFTFDYRNIQSVKLLTLAAPETEIQADIQEARQAEETSAQESEQTQGSGIVKDIPFDAAKDAADSDDLVVSFLISAGASADDQALFYLVSSAALAILHPGYPDDRAAFDDLRQNVFSLYAGNTADADYVSWIDRMEGVPESAPLTVPGNAVECWFGTKADRSLWLDITLYIRYDALIDVGVAVG